MTEFRRISKQRRWRISFLGLFLLSIGLFVFFCQKETIGNRHQSNKENQAILHQMKEQSLKMSQTQLKKKIESLYSQDIKLNMRERASYEALLKQVDYLMNFPHKLDNIQKQVDRLKEFEIFNDPNSYEYQNIQKTNQDFGGLKDSHLSVGNDQLVLSVMNDSGIIICAFLLMLLTALALVQEENYQLGRLFQTYKNGRGMLALWRIVVLLFSSLLAVIAFYASKIFLAGIYYEEQQDFSRQLQSIEEFGNYPYAMTIGTFFFRYGIFLLFSFFVLGLVLWVLLSYVRNINRSLIILGVVLMGEYYLYQNVGISDTMSWSRSLNIINMLSMKLTYFRYQNYQIFGHIFGEQTLIYGVMVLLAVTSITIMMRRAIFGYYAELKSHFQLFSKIVVVFRRKCNRLFLSEQKKLWLTNKGLIILIAYVFFLMMMQTLPSQDIEEEELAVRQVVGEYEGKINNQLIHRMESDREKLQRQIQKFQERSGDVTWNEKQYAYALGKVVAMETVEKKVKVLNKEDSKLYLSRYWQYETVYGKTGHNWRMEHFIVLVMVSILILIPLFAYDQEYNMKTYMHTLPKGTNQLFWHKVRTGIGFSVIIWLIHSVYSIEIMKNHFYEHWCSGIWGNARQLEIGLGKQMDVSLIKVLILLYGSRLLIIICICLIILLLSQVVNSRIKGISLCMAVLILPAAASRFSNLSWLKMISPVMWLTDVGLVVNIRNVWVGVILIPVLLWVNQRLWRGYDK